MQRSRSKFFVTSSTLSLQDARVFCNTVYSLLAYPPASLVKSTFIGSASRSSVFIVFPNFLKSSLFPCVSRAALFAYLTIVSFEPAQIPKKKKSLRFKHHEYWRIALGLTMYMIPERTRLVRLYSFGCGCQKLFDLENISCLFGTIVLVLISRHTLSALPGLGVMMAMTSKGLDMVT